MMSYDFGIRRDFGIGKEGEITYADMSFKSFKVREVYVGGK